MEVNAEMSMVFLANSGLSSKRIKTTIFGTLHSPYVFEMWWNEDEQDTLLPGFELNFGPGQNLVPLRVHSVGLA